MWYVFDEKESIQYVGDREQDATRASEKVGGTKVQASTLLEARRIFRELIRQKAYQEERCN